MSMRFMTGAVLAGATIAVLSTLPVLAGGEPPVSGLKPAPAVHAEPLEGAAPGEV